MAGNSSNSLLRNMHKIFPDYKFNNSESPVLPLEIILARLDNDIRADMRPDDIKVLIDYIVSKDRSILNDPTFAFLATACATIKMRVVELDSYKEANIAKKLLDLGVDVNIPDRNGNTPLMHAALSIDTDLVTRLINMGANLNAVNKKGESALIHVCSMFALNDIYDPKYLQKLAQHALLLIEKGANVHIKDEYSRNAMDYATDALTRDKRFSQQIIDALGKASAAAISASANINAAIQRAIRSNNPKTKKSFVPTGVRQLSNHGRDEPIASASASAAPRTTFSGGPLFPNELDEPITALGKASAATASASIPPARRHANVAPRPAASAAPASIQGKATYTNLQTRAKANALGIPLLPAALQVPGLSKNLETLRKAKNIRRIIQTNDEARLGGVRRKTHRRKNRKQTKRKRTRS